VNGFRSRKFLQAAAAELALLAALAACLADEGLRPYLPYVIGGLVAVAVGYGVANAWQTRGPADGWPPGA
jgi:hypothetical protein